MATLKIRVGVPEKNDGKCQTYDKYKCWKEMMHFEAKIEAKNLYFISLVIFSFILSTLL